ncbi:ATP-binding protein [Arcobacter aquimarinus]|uniref:ATP-binding protein (AAA domain) n=1 Tax=Arcobacter aquimarinus TaxID=1315211 RepID=A0AAE7B332_9BACT|nr:DNA/RNA helicase domain-containing protein [Arcobacter aquimarinus]QKE26116.1 ATP-binding protein (AAA domain) [Arcobacter aquimarinus]RXI36225.1 ATP-binding protein [Arcobacter aquimarinus]
MKKINLLMLDNIFVSNPEILLKNSVKEYLNLEDLKEQEKTTINRLCNIIKGTKFHHHFFENYYLNYQIPQIGKEFDLLRISDKLVINIELKSEAISNEDILKQLERNYYYLSFLKKEIHCYTFVTENSIDKLYYYDENIKTITEVEISNLIVNLIKINDFDDINIDGLFNPSNYLISPFNKTAEFLKGEYFLTKQQEQIKNTILKKIDENCQNKIFSISGAAGTGKTLLTYDIAKELKNLGKNITVIHCAQKNNGIYDLIENGWNIKAIKEYKVGTLTSDVIIFDESQRISKYQLDSILKNEQNYIIFSHDVNQKLNTSNQAEEVVSYIEKIANKYILTNKVRHNKNLASFLKKFFDLSTIKIDELSKDDYKNISFYFTNELDDARLYVEYLKSIGWEHIYLTNSLRTAEPLDNVKFSSNNSSHQAIGQEYDNVVIVINEYFYYTEQLKLSYNARYYYNPLETLFQAITRTRKKLKLVIINNEKVYKKCIQIINRE